MNTNEPIHLGLNGVNRAAMTVPRYYGNKLGYHLPKQLISCRWDKARETIGGIIYDPNKKEIYEIEEHAHFLWEAYGLADNSRSAEENAFRKHALELYALGRGELHILSPEEDNHPMLAHLPIYAIYWVDTVERWLLVDAQLYRAARLKYSHEVRNAMVYQHPEYLETKPMTHTQPVPFLKDVFIRLTVQAKTVKVNPSKGDIIRYDIRDWVKEIRRDLGSTLGSTAGGIIRRIDTGSLILDEVTLYLITSHCSALPILGILTMRSGKRSETITIPPSSFDRYRSVIARVAGSHCIINIDA